MIPVVGDWYKGQGVRGGVVYIGQCTRIDRFGRDIVYIEGIYYLSQAGTLVLADRPFGVGLHQRISSLTQFEMNQVIMHRFTAEYAAMRKRFRWI